jgi:hypothetical protein
MTSMIALARASAWMRGGFGFAGATINFFFDCT